MKIEIIRSLDEVHKARDLTVVIDVFRAFTTEAYIFANGAELIIPIGTLDEAYDLKDKHPDYVLVGERRGIKPKGFDFGNSPTEILEVDFTGKTIIHTTENGTKGLLGASGSKTVLAGSFVMATSIVEYIKKRDQDVYLVSTSPEYENENEDILLAYYIRDLLTGLPVDEGDIKSKLLTTGAYNFLLREAGVPQSDFDLCLDFNTFSFVIKKIEQEGRMCLVRVNM